MIERLPSAAPFLPQMMRWRLADARTEAAGGFGIPPVSVTTDGGGYWVAEFGEMRAATDPQHRALRGLAARMRGGKRINVPFFELAPTGGLEEVSFSDGTTYDDGTGEIAGLTSAVLEEAVAANAFTCLIRVTAGPDLRGDDVFSAIRSAALGEELHLCESLTLVEPGLWEATVAPQFRQAHAAGTELNFNDPACAMKLDDPEGQLWGRFDRTWIARPSARFVEAVR